MNKLAFTPEQRQFICEHYPEHGGVWVADKIGKKLSQIKTFAKYNKLLRSNLYHAWTETELEKIRQDFPHRLTGLIAEELGLAYHLVSNQAYRMGLKKTNVFYKSQECNRLDGVRGQASRFKKGHKTHNKGVTMSPELREKVKHTWWKKGNEPTNTKYNGYERISQTGYIEIRISKGIFAFLHAHIWEYINGPVPEGHIVVFKDRNRQNFEPENIELITMQENMDRNSIVRYPAELRSLIRTHSKLKKSITNGTKQTM